MLVLEERAANGIAVAPNIAQMQEMHAIAQPLHHARQVVVRTRAQRARAESDAVGGQVHRRHALGVVGLGRHDAWQAQQTERWVVRVAAKPQAHLLGDRRYLLEEVMEMLA